MATPGISTNTVAIPVACTDLARAPRILDSVAAVLAALGVIGEEQIIQLVFLALVSRLLDRVVSLMIKGPSSAGKSYVVQQTFRLFPARAYHELTSMSDRALVYSKVSFKHRMILMYEASGLSEKAEYFIRSLLSEGRLRYEVTEKVADKPHETRMIDQEGPTGFIITTTAVRLHPENETRMLSLTVNDTPEQTKSILKVQAAEKTKRPTVDLAAFLALQEWLANAEHRVVIPFAPQIVEHLPLADIRIRRDFPTVLGLIEAHALLHQASRDRNTEGCIIATLDDYTVVRELVNGTLGDGLGSIVKLETREVIAAVKTLTDSGKPHVAVIEIATHLSIHKSSALRRVRVALERGYLVNNELHEGRRAQLVLGDPLPEDKDVLPEPSKLMGCTVAQVSEGTVDATTEPSHADSQDI